MDLKVKINLPELEKKPKNTANLKYKTLSETEAN